MKWGLDVARFLMLSGLLLILIGYWAPWVDHPAAGLVQNGFDLSEFVKFMPQVKSGSERLVRWLFFLPLSTVALGLSLLAQAMPGSRRHWLHPGLVAVSLVLLIVLIPPYPYTLQRLLGDEFRARTILALVSWTAFLLTLAWGRRWLMRRWIASLLALSTLVGTVSPIAQFLSLRDALGAVYGCPVTIGWGVWLMVGGALVLLGGIALEVRKGKEYGETRGVSRV